MTRRISIAVLLIFLPQFVFGAEGRLPAKLRVTVLFTVLSYNSGFDRLRASGLRVGVMSAAGNADSKKEALETLAEIQALSSKKVRGITISAVPVEVRETADVGAAIEREGLSAIYLSSGLEKVFDTVLNLARAKKLLTLTGEATHVRAGAAIGVVERDQKPKILVNIKEVSAQGGTLDAQVLRVVEIVQ